MDFIHGAMDDMPKLLPEGPTAIPEKQKLGRKEFITHHFLSVTIKKYYVDSVEVK